MQLFDKNTPLAKGEYESFKFVGCDFSDVNLSGFKFSMCEFEDCNLSLAKLGNTAFREVTFKSCKLLGLRFSDCDPFGLDLRFERCQLSHAVFYRLKLKKMHFGHCQLKEADFSESDLTQAVFEHCDLADAVFDRTILEKADLSTSVNYRIDPEKNKIKKAQFSMAGLVGLLQKYDIQVKG